MTQAEPVGPVLAKVGAHGAVTVDEFTLTASRQALMRDAEVTLEDRKVILDEMIDEEALFQEAFTQGLYRDPKVRSLMINLLKRREVVEEARQLEISDEEAKAYFDAHISDFRMPEKALVKRIFIAFGESRTEEEASELAADLRAQIVSDPEKFRKLAEEFSEDSYQRRGGTMGYVERAGLALPAGVPRQGLLA
jgi:parvulin-like peptidyl-prolyl isomerase